MLGQIPVTEYREINFTAERMKVGSSQLGVKVSQRMQFAGVRRKDAPPS